MPSSPLRCVIGRTAPARTWTHYSNFVSREALPSVAGVEATDTTQAGEGHQASPAEEGDGETPSAEPDAPSLRELAEARVAQQMAELMAERDRRLAAAKELLNQGGNAQMST
jgi:hypothetical protein